MNDVFLVLWIALACVTIVFIAVNNNRRGL